MNLQLSTLPAQQVQQFRGHPLQFDLDQLLTPLIVWYAKMFQVPADDLNIVVSGGNLTIYPSTDLIFSEIKSLVTNLDVLVGYSILRQGKDVSISMTRQGMVPSPHEVLPAKCYHFLNENNAKKVFAQLYPFTAEAKLKVFQKRQQQAGVVILPR